VAEPTGEKEPAGHEGQVTEELPVTTMAAEARVTASVFAVPEHGSV
jgi:hypothetical protein